MIQTIHVGHVLRETIATPYRNLVTRPTGAAVRNRIQEVLAGSDCATAVLDFSDIELLDFSCADEIVAKLLLAGVGCAGRFVVLGGLREDQHEAIEHVLTHHRLAVAAVPAPLDPDEAPRLLGWVSPDARAAFACVCEHGALLAEELARALDWSAARGEAALSVLVLHRLVRPDGNRYHRLPIA